MREAMLVGFIWAFLLAGAIWFAIIFIANRTTLKAKPDVRFAAIVFGVVSVPAYLYLSVKYEQHSFETRRIQEQRIAYNSIQRYRKICSEKPAIYIQRVVQQASPVDVKVIDVNLNGRLEIPMSPDRACWFVINSSRCKRSNIGSIGWSETDFKSIKPKFFRFSAIGVQGVSGFSSPYALQVSAKEQIEPLIDKYRVSIRNVETGLILAETSFYQISDNQVRATSAEMGVPRYCPEVDLHLADMFSQVFPIPQNPQTGP